MSVLVLSVAVACSSEDATPGSAATPDGSTGSDGSTPNGNGDGAAPEDGGLDAAPDAEGGPVAPPLSDEFDGTSLSINWIKLHPELVTLTVANGSLSIQAAAQSLWFNASEGPQIYKSVTGDFKVTAKVHARRVATADPPTQNIHLGGLMARNPVAGQNYVFIVAGRDDQGESSIETKTTTNSVSTYTNPVWPNGDAELRICRLGAIFRMYKRAIGTDVWTIAATFNRPDMPAALAVGPNIYANAAAPDLIVSFEQVTYAVPAGEGDCTL